MICLKRDEPNAIAEKELRTPEAQFIFIVSEGQKTEPLYIQVLA